MDAPILLNLPLGNTASPGADSASVKADRSAGNSFSDHLEKRVDDIKGKENTPSNKPLEKNEGVVKARADKASKPVEAEIVASSKEQLDDDVNSAPPTSGQLPKGLAALAENEALLEQAPGLSVTIGVISEKRGLEPDAASLAEGGNELPLAELDGDVLAGVTGKELEAELAPVASLIDDGLNTFDDSTINNNVKDITFDPLSQAKESSAHIAALTAGHLPEQKTRFNGKNSSGEFFKPVGLTMPFGETASAKIPEAVLDQMQKPQADLAAGLIKEASLAKPSGFAETVSTQMTGIVSQAIQQPTVAQALTDRAPIGLETPVNHPRWGEDFSQRVQWMVNQKLSGAQIRLNPQHMGPIEVRIQIQNDQATVSFTAQHGATREAIDAALPRLREMLSEQNVEMVDVDVSQHSFAEQREQQASRSEGGENQLNDNMSDVDESVFDEGLANGQRQYNGLFSDYA